jgi:hypothetical protein
MEVNRFRIATLDSWETCVRPILPPDTTNDIHYFVSWLRKEHTLVHRAFIVFVNDS